MRDASFKLALCGCFVVVCGEGFPAFDVVSDKFLFYFILFGICVSKSFLVRVCMFTVSNALLMSSATAMVRAGGILWLKPDAIVLLML